MLASQTLKQMTQSEKAKSVSEGQIYQYFYSDTMEYSGYGIIISRTTNSSIFYKAYNIKVETEHRVSRNSFQRYLDKAIYRLISK